MIDCVFSVVDVFVDYKCSALSVCFVSSADLINSSEFPEYVVQLLS